MFKFNFFKKKETSPVIEPFTNEKPDIDFRVTLAEYASKPEIENVLDIITDCIQIENLTVTKLPVEYKKYQKKLNSNLIKIKSLLFTEPLTEYHLIKKYLTYGSLSFEKILTTDNKSIIGFSELDHENEILTESLNQKIINITYDDVTDQECISYVDSLISSFNQLQSIDGSKILWYFTNSNIYKKFIIPVGNVKIEVVRESLKEYSKDIWLPSPNNTESPDFETLNLALTDNESYFKYKFKRATKISYVDINSDDINYNNVEFKKFISNIQDIFYKIILEPLYDQMILDYPELEKDENFKSLIKINK